MTTSACIHSWSFIACAVLPDRHAGRGMCFAMQPVSRLLCRCDTPLPWGGVAEGGPTTVRTAAAYMDRRGRRGPVDLSVLRPPHTSYQWSMGPKARPARLEWKALSLLTCIGAWSAGSFCWSLSSTKPVGPLLLRQRLMVLQDAVMRSVVCTFGPLTVSAKP